VRLNEKQSFEFERIVPDGVGVAVGDAVGDAEGLALGAAVGTAVTAAPTAAPTASPTLVPTAAPTASPTAAERVKGRDIHICKKCKKWKKSEKKESMKGVQIHLCAEPVKVGRVDDRAMKMRCGKHDKITRVCNDPKPTT
jgi:hypothetical protein